MHKILLIVLFAVSLGTVSAQTFTGKLNPFPHSAPAEITAGDTLKILAVMVNFQEDKDNTTFGNGKFGTIYSKDYGTDILDPLPHDRRYFETHLEFVKNYYSKVSNNSLNIEYTVLPDTFSVSKTMRSYSPPAQSEDYKLLADFAVEAWTKAAVIYPDFDFSSYDVFLIFHAGVGRDISLPGSVGTEKDLPSIYIGDKLFKKIYGDTFSGIPAGQGNFNITNSIIMPETESRELESFGGKVLFEITINGLLVASVASHLGLPDLFDTKTGLSAIGRFGLMDGQAIFAYGGTYPPEPSPWEKIYLGWAQAVEISPGEYKNLSLTAGLAASLSDTVILKVPINSSEYFLVENRSRDARDKGSIVTAVVGSDTVTYRFTNDTTGYYSYAVDSLAGVVIDVDEFDWALPGSGIVIWHIDESIIESNLASNSINNDKNNRGVDVEEADGVQDIGEQFQTIFGDRVIGEGTEEDLWYKGNPAELYKNRFSKETLPNTNSNSGANSLITFAGFSEIKNKMTFNLTYGDSIIKPIFSVNIGSAIPDGHLNVLQNNTDYSFALINQNDLLQIDKSGSVTAQIPGFTKKTPASLFWNDTEYYAGAFNSSLNVFMRQGAVSYPASVQINEIISSAPLFRVLPTEEREIIFGTSSGRVHFYSTGMLPAVDPAQTKAPVLIDSSISISHLASDGVFYAGAGDNKNRPEIYYFDSDNHQYLIPNEILVDFALTKDKNGRYTAVVLSDAGKFYVITEGSLSFSFETRGENVNSFSIADLKQDGENYILYNSGAFIYAVNLSGAAAENFPFEDPEGMMFTLKPLAADIEGDTKSEVISITEDGRIFAVFGGSGKIVPGFPLTIGSKPAAVPVLFLNNKMISVSAAGQKGNFSAYTISASDGEIYWSGSAAGPGNNAFVEAAGASNITSDFFPKEKAYNYPNPVYDASTYIRYFVSENSKINIKIFDLAGGFVAELNNEAVGGMDNETKWDVTGIQSGVYFARIEAAGSSGKTETNIIKIAVIK